jgi:hypothetical protein
MLSPLIAVALLAPALASPQSQKPACELGGQWTRNDHIQTIEVYSEDGRWFARLLSSSKKGATPGFVLFRDFVYDPQKRAFKGTVIVPTSGLRATAELTCLDETTFKVTAHKFFITKSFVFDRSTHR